MGPGSKMKAEQVEKAILGLLPATRTAQGEHLEGAPTAWDQSHQCQVGEAWQATDDHCVALTGKYKILTKNVPFKDQRIKMIHTDHRT